MAALNTDRPGKNCGQQIRFFEENRIRAVWPGEVSTEEVRGPKLAGPAEKEEKRKGAPRCCGDGKGGMLSFHGPTAGRGPKKICPADCGAEKGKNSFCWDLPFSFSEMVFVGNMGPCKVGLWNWGRSMASRVPVLSC